VATIFLREGRSTYYVRVFVPASLHGILGRREIWKSLETESYETAKIRAALCDGRLSELFLLLKGNGGMKREQIDALVKLYVTAKLREAEEGWLTRRISEDDRETLSLAITDALEATQEQLVSNDFKKVQDIADDLLAAHHVTLDKDSLDYKRLCHELLKGHQAIFKKELDRCEGRFESLEDLGFSAGNGNGATIPATASLVPPKPLGEALTLYFQENQRAVRTDVQIKSGFEKFMSIVGCTAQTPIQELTKAECRRYKEGLLKFPRALNTEQKAMPTADLLASLPAAGYKTLSVSSINKYLHNLTHFFEWAKRQGFYEGENPAHSLIIPKGAKVRGEKRKPFTDDELARIFGHPDFKRQLARNPERYWLVLTLLYTGARREEIAQLNLSDIQSEGTILFFNITTDDSGEGLKNEHSKRRVPVHSHLLKLGFQAYLNQMKAAGSNRLFPQLTKGRNGYGDAVGKWFGRYLTAKLHLTDPAKVVHSFRHTFITRLHSLAIPQTIAEILVGHAADGVHGQVYLHRDAVPLTLLKEHLERLDYWACVKGLVSTGR
jgi:integrase